MDFRGAEDADLDQFAHLQVAHYLGYFPLTADDLRAPTSTRRYVLADAGRVVAAAAVADPGQGPKVRRVELFTGPEESFDDAWREIHDRVATILILEGVDTFQSVIREDFPAARRLRAAGYRVGWSSWSARLHLDGPVPEGAYDDVLAAHPGTRVVEIDATASAAAFALYEACVPDFPWTPATVPPRYSAEQFAYLLSTSRAWAVFDGARCVALTVSQVDGEAAETEFTVVAAERRKLGLARLVKAAGIKALAADGVRVFSTGGADANTASLRMNQALGYDLDPMWHTYALDLRAV